MYYGVKIAKDLSFNEKKKLIQVKGLGMCMVDQDDESIENIYVAGVIISKHRNGRIKNRSRNQYFEQGNREVRLQDIRIKRGLLVEIDGHIGKHGHSLIRKGSLEEAMITQGELLHEQQPINSLGWEDLSRVYSKLRVSDLYHQKEERRRANYQTANGIPLQKTKEAIGVSILVKACSKRMESLIYEEKKRKNKYYTPQEIDIFSTDGLESLLREYNTKYGTIREERGTGNLFPRRLITNGRSDLTILGQYNDGQYGFENRKTM